MVSFLQLLVSAAAAAALPSQSLRSPLVRRTESWDTWCGAIQSSPPGQVQSAEASWVVPTVSAPAGGSNQVDWVEYHWVGIDGTGPCTSGILQAGTSGDVSNAAEILTLYTHAESLNNRSTTAKSQRNSGGSSGLMLPFSSTTCPVCPCYLILISILTWHSEPWPGSIRQGHR